MQTVIKTVNPRMTLAHWHNAQLNIIRAPIELADVELMDRAYTELLARFPKGVCGVSLVAAAAASTPAAARDGAGKMMKRLGKGLLRSSMHIDGGGVMATLLGTVVRGMNAVSGGAFAISLLGSPEALYDDAAAYIRTPAGGVVTPAELATAMNGLRSTVMAAA